MEASQSHPRSFHIADHIGRAAAGQGYFEADPPLCSGLRDSALATVYLRNVYFQTYYTNPGYIAIRPYYARWLGAGSFGAAQSDQNWTYLEAPADGTVYPWRMANSLVPWMDKYGWFHIVYWWDGTQWTNGRSAVFNTNHLQTVNGVINTGPTCWT